MLKILHLFFLFGLGVMLNTTNAQSESQLKQIAIAEYGEFLLYAPLYVAHAKGYFREENLDVRIIPAGGDEKVFAALLAGDAQFGVGDPTFVAISGSRGKPGKIICSLIRNMPAWGIAIDPKVPPITDPKMLKPFKVGALPAPSTSYAIQRKMFVEGGLEPNIVQIRYGGLIPALQAKRIDIALEYEPNVSLAEKTVHARRVYSVMDRYPNLAVTGLSVLPEYLASNRDTARGVVRAIRRGLHDVRTHPEVTVEVLAERFKELTPDVISTAIQASVKAQTFPSNGAMEEAGWIEAIAIRKELGDLTEDAPFESYVDNSLVRE